MRQRSDKPFLHHPGERQEAEYKASIQFDADSDFGLRLIKHILGMANTGGGWIVIGYDDNTLKPDRNLSPDLAATYDSTLLSDAVDKCIAGEQPIRLSVFQETHPRTGTTHPVIRIQEFDRSPFICRSTKSAADSDKPVLQSGKVYIRRPGAATSEIQAPSEWDDLLKRCVAHRRDEFLREFTDLFSRMNAGDASLTTETTDVNTTTEEWMANRWRISNVRDSIQSEGGYIESACMLVESRHQQWTINDLHAAARSAKWRYWDKFVPIEDGIEVRLGRAEGLGVPEYWCLNQNGDYYSSSLLLEDYENPGFRTSVGHPKRSLWFDLAIRRITFELMESVALYKELGVAPDEPYLLKIRHGGLRGRTLYAASPNYFFNSPQAKQANVHEWHHEVTQDLINGQLMELACVIADSLFVLFNFTKISKKTTEGIVNQVTKLYH